jgi:Ran-binding protein 1
MKIRVKLFRWRDEQWKERGIGNAKLMRDREEKRTRFVMRQEKTLKPVANFISKCHRQQTTGTVRFKLKSC